jgi:hypothetical protein
MRVSLYRREGSRNWSVRYRDVNGKLQRRSTGTNNEDAARQISAQIEEELAATARTNESSRADHFTPSESDGSPNDIFRQIESAEVLMLSIVHHQARAQEIAAKSISATLNQLAVRVRKLERRLDQLFEMTIDHRQGQDS